MDTYGKYLMKQNYKDFILEQYYEFMIVEYSTLDSGSYEPSNTTKVFGL